MNKKILLMVFAALFLISFVSMTSAATSINLTIANRTAISGSYILNATLTDAGAANTIGNVSFAYQAWGGSWINFANKTNQSSNQWYFNYTWDTTAIADGRNYTINITAWNVSGTLINSSNLTGNITIDNNAPTMTIYYGPAATPTAWPNGTIIKTSVATNLTLNISISDNGTGVENSSVHACYVNIDGSALVNTINLTVAMNRSGGSNFSAWCNTSNLNISSLADGNHTIWIYANDTNTSSNMRLNKTFYVQIDTTNPTATATCSPTTVSVGDTFPCTCATADATSGINSAESGGSTTSPDGTVVPSSTGVFTYTCSAVDNAALTYSASATYTITQSGGAAPSSSGTSGGTSATKKATSTASEINPGAATVMKYSDPTIGVKQISVEVNNKAQSVQITVTKEAGKPANVSVAKSGKVYQYLHIETKNLADKLNKATVQFKVNKTWVSDNGLTKEKVAVSKFDETGNKWNELTTTYTNEDNSYYYYDVELTSFSYFAISEKGVTASATGETGGETGGEETTGGSLTWLWILIVLVVLVAIGWTVKAKSKSQ